jgi:hypothetical protein
MKRSRCSVALGDILQRLKEFFGFSRNGSIRPSATVRQATAARAHRHDVMIALQEDVRRLQQQISELSDREGNEHIGEDPEDESAEMQSLHRQLSRKQAQLAKYQARI